MGTTHFLSTIRDNQIQIDQSLLNCSSSKLRQYYSSYKSICQSFSITISEFIQIFGHNQKAFQAFDPKKKGRIDAIEMFTALIIFSGVNYQQKIKFLFEIFDFNQQGWLSYEAVTFLLINACNATYKIYSIPQTVNSKQIESFLNEYFYQQSQIGLEKFIKWSRKIDEFMSFFNIIEQEFEPYYEMKRIDKLKEEIVRQRCGEYKRLRNLQEQLSQQLQLQQENEYSQQGSNMPIHVARNNILMNQPDTMMMYQNQKTPITNSLFDNDYNNNSRAKSIKGNKQHQNDRLLFMSSSPHSNSSNRTLLLLNNDNDNMYQLHNNNNNNNRLSSQSTNTTNNKKVKKLKYGMNFQFDNKFVDVLASLVAPEQQQQAKSYCYYNGGQGYQNTIGENNNNSNVVGNSKMLNQRQVNFYFQNSGNFINNINNNNNNNLQQQQQQQQDDNSLSQQDQPQQQKFNPSLKWLYGINITIPNPIKFLQTTDHKASNQVFIYTINHLIILFYPKINVQQHYTQHRNKISAFQISKNKNYVVSADYGEDYQLEFPEIHVWAVRDRKVVVKWRNVHKGRIHKLAWTREDRNVVAISLYENKWAVKIIDVLSQNILLSTYILMDPLYNTLMNDMGNMSQYIQQQHDSHMIDILECQKPIVMMMGNNQRRLSRCILVYTNSSVTYLVPNQQQYQENNYNNNMNVNKSGIINNSDNSNSGNKVEYSVVTKYLNSATNSSSSGQAGQYGNNSNNLFYSGTKTIPNNNQKPQQSLTITNNNEFNNNNRQQPSSSFRSGILQIIQYSQERFLCVHNDRKIRLWDCQFETYQIIYTRDVSEKALIKVMLVQMGSDDSSDGNININDGNPSMLDSKNKRLFNTKNNQPNNNIRQAPLTMMMRTSSSSSKKGYQNSLMTKGNTNKFYNTTSSNKKSPYYNTNNKQQQFLNENNLQNKNKLLIILDEQKLQLLSLFNTDNNNNKSLLLNIPQSLYNLMLIDMQLVETKRLKRELLVVSLFGDVIRVVGLEKVLEGFVANNSNMRNNNSNNSNNNNNNLSYEVNRSSQQPEGIFSKLFSRMNSHQHQYQKQQQKNNQLQNIPLTQQLQKLITYRKYYQLFLLQKIKDYHSHEQHDIIIANNLLYKINSDQRQLVTLISFDYQLKAISACNNIYAILTENDSRYIYLLIDEAIVEKIKLVHDVTAFKLINTHLILCSSKCIQIYTKSYDKYFSQESRKIQIDSNTPVDICATQNPYKFLITTMDRELYFLEIKNYDFKYKKVKSIGNTIVSSGGGNSSLGNNTGLNSAVGGIGTAGVNSININSGQSQGQQHHPLFNNANVNNVNNINNVNSLNTNTMANMMATESYLQITYPQLMDCYSMVFYPQQKFISLGLNNGEVRVWDGVRKLYESKEFNEQYYQLTSHYGPVQKLRLRFFQQNVQLITLGRQDGMAIVYSHKQYVIADKDSPSQQPLINNYSSNLINNPNQYQNNNRTSQQSINNYTNYSNLCNYLNEITLFNTAPNIKQTISYNNQDTLKYSLNVLKDSQLLVSLFDDSLPPWVQKIITNIVHPSTDNYEPLTSQYQHTRASLISLQISHVYGLFAQKARHTTGYIHHYPKSKLQPQRFQDIFEATGTNDNSGQYITNFNNNNKQQKSISTEKQQPSKNKLAFSYNKLLPLNEQHENCKREIIYFIDRLIVLISPQSKKQRVYSFHKSQVTTFHIHPNKRIVCSAQRGITQPVIHIWDAQSLVLMRSIKTRHKSGSIYKVEFSRQGTYVLTLSGCSNDDNTTTNQYDRNSYLSSTSNNKNFTSLIGNTGGSYGMGNNNNINNFNNNNYNNFFNNPQINYISLDIIQWRYSNSVLYKVLFNEQIFAVKFNPYCQTEICLGGRDSLKIFSFQLGNLVTKQTLTHFSQTITSLTYSSALYGNDIQSDIILGTLQGNILLYICGKLITVKKIHESSINFIQLNEIFKYKTIVVTGSEDGMVKLWDMKFNLLTKLNIKEQLLMGKNVQDFTSYSFAPQSIDFYSCYPSKQTQSNNSYILLISTRSGHILQSKLTNEYQGLKSIQNEKVTIMKQKLSLQTKIIVRNNTIIDEQTDFQLIGEKVMVSYSVGSCVVMLWNIQKNEYLSYVLLKYCPSTIKYNPLTSKLYIGYYKTSQIQVYVLKDNSLHLYETFSIKSDYYPDNIVFCSSNSSLLAVSLVLNTMNLLEYNANGNTMGNNNMSMMGLASVGTCIEVYEYKQGWRGSNVNSNTFSGMDSSNKGSNMNSNKNPLKEYEMRYRIDQNKKRGVLSGNLTAGTVIGSVWMEFSSTGQQLLVLYSQKKLVSNYYLRLINNMSNNNISNNNTSISTNNPTTTLQHIHTTQHAQKLSKSSQFTLYNILQKKQKQSQHMQQFFQLNFYPFIKVNYLYHDKLVNGFVNGNNGNNMSSNAVVEMKEKSMGQQGNTGELLHPMVSQMAQYHKYIVIGTTMGELIFVHSDFFCTQHRKLYPPTQLYKYFKLFSSPITKISTFSDRIIVSSSRCNSIINIRVINNEQISLSIDLRDEFSEKVTQQYLQKSLKLTFPKRKYIYQSRFTHSDKQNQPSYNKKSSQQKKLSKMKNIKTYKQTQLSSTYQIQINSNQLSTKKRISLELQSVIGRNAMYKRNNIFIDLRENIISHTGCNLVILKKNSTISASGLLSAQQQQLAYLNSNKPNKDNKFNANNNEEKRVTYTQEFLKLDMTPFSTFAEICTLNISQDRRLIFAGTNQENAKLLIWDISTRTHIKQISLKDMISIRRIGVSSSNNYLALIAMNKKGQNILFFIDVNEENVLAAFTFSPQHSEINDIKFFPALEFMFLLCGNNYMAEWRYNGQLTFEHYNIDNPSDFIDTKEKTNTMKPQSHVIFYSLAFLKDILISAGSDGYLYIWNDKRIIKKQNAHPKSAILCLYASSSSRIFASGGADGKAIVWQLSSSSIIQKIFQFSIYHGRQQKIPVRYHIQSVCISKNNIIVGTRSGEVYEFLCNDIEQIQKLKQQWKKGINLILPAFDDDTINSISFNTSSQKLFMLTQSGCFSVFDLSTMQKVREQKIDIGKSQIIKMVVCKLSYRIFIVLKNSVISYYYMYNKQEKVQKFRKGKEILKVQQLSFIKNAIMSSNEKYLALLMASAQMDLYSIQLYDLSQPQGQFFKQYKILDHIPTNVNVIDFSTDNEYLICKNTQDEETIIHLSTHEIINPNSIQFQLQYSDEAKKTSKYIRDVLQLYGQENQLLKIAQVMNHSIIATDQMGSIRVFEYPIIAGSSKDKQDVSYYRFYVEHLNQVYLCVLSQDSRLLATVGREDRSLFLWKVKQT